MQENVDSPSYEPSRNNQPVNYENLYHNFRKYFDDGFVRTIWYSDQYAILRFCNMVYMIVPFMKENYNYICFQASKETCEVMVKRNNLKTFALWMVNLKKQMGEDNFQKVTVLICEENYEYYEAHRDDPLPYIDPEWEEYIRRKYAPNASKEDKKLTFTYPEQPKTGLRAKLSNLFSRKKV